MGFCTVYDFYMHPNKIRSRISQFVILPPYQKKGNGKLFYKIIQKHMRLIDDVGEITVEDGNDDFQAMRTSVDSSLLTPYFSLDSMPSKEIIEIIRKDFKWNLVKSILIDRNKR